MNIAGPSLGASGDCERILRTLPKWFGIEEALQEYVRDTTRFPTFVADADARAIAFVTVRAHFPQAWEVHCIAVESSWRGRGVGTQLHAYVERWLTRQGARLLQVKTLAALHSSREYAQTRALYQALGYVEHEVFPTLWGAKLPVLQLVKVLGRDTGPVLTAPP
jgi:GNAT superfamily N-acetyltransferase